MTSERFWGLPSERLCAARARWQPRPVVVDGAAAVLLLAVSLPGLWFVPEALRLEPREPDVLGVVLVALGSLPLTWRRVRPVISFVVLLAASVALSALGYLLTTNGIAVLVGLYTIATCCRLRTSVLSMDAAILSFVIVSAYDIYPGGIPDVIATVAVLFGAWAVGRSVRIRRAYTASLEERAAQLEAARVADARAAVAEERARIARELHDVVAHHVSVMTVQAAAAQRMLGRDPALAKEAMAAVESTGRTALGEMRSIVGVLRESAHAGAKDSSGGLAPQPRVADLDELVDSVSEAGLQVTLLRTGDLSDLPAGIDLAVYRIVQEALTNALKHAGPTTAEVTVRRTPEAVHLSVVDSGRGAAAALVHDTPGHGLIGMRERVALYGGRLTAGARPGGGYAVEATIPLAPSPPVADLPTAPADIPVRA